MIAYIYMSMPISITMIQLDLMVIILTLSLGLRIPATGPILLLLWIDCTIYKITCLSRGAPVK